jgi:hypothetical protein
MMTAETAEALIVMTLGRAMDFNLARWRENEGIICQRVIQIGSQSR